MSASPCSCDHHLRRRRVVTYANVAATLALVMAAGGTAYAATSLPANSVGALQIRAGAVTAPKIANRSVTAAKLARGVAMNFRGTWSPRLTYATQDLVTAPTGVWVAVSTPPRGRAPGVPNWRRITAPTRTAFTTTSRTQVPLTPCSENEVQSLTITPTVDSWLSVSGQIDWEALTTAATHHYDGIPAVNLSIGESRVAIQRGPFVRVWTGDDHRAGATVTGILSDPFSGAAFRLRAGTTYDARLTLDVQGDCVGSPLRLGASFAATLVAPGS